MKWDCNIISIFNANINDHNKCDLNIIKNINIIKRLVDLKINVAKI